MPPAADRELIQAFVLLGDAGFPGDPVATLVALLYRKTDPRVIV